MRLAHQAVPAGFFALFMSMGSASADESIDKMCADLGKGSGDALAQCRSDENAAAQEVFDWFDKHNLLLSDGKVNFDKIDAATVKDSPEDTAGFCWDETDDFVDLWDCIDTLYGIDK